MQSCSRPLSDTAHQHLSTFFKHLSHQHSSRLRHFSDVFFFKKSRRKFTSDKTRPVFPVCLISMSPRARRSWDEADVRMHNWERCKNLLRTMEHEAARWTTDDPAVAVELGRRHLLLACRISPASRGSWRKTSSCCVGMLRRAGMPDKVRRIGLRLDAPSWHHQRRLGSVLDFQEWRGQFYTVAGSGPAEQF